MNLHWAYIILSLLIFVKLTSSKAYRVQFEKDLQPDTGNRYHRHHTDYSEFNPYYNSWKRPYTKRHYSNFIKKMKHPHNEKSFIDLTRDNEGDMDGTLNKFSEDYIDISELARHGKTPPQIYELESEQTNNRLKDTYDTTYEALNLLDQIARRMVPYEKRSVPDSDSDESTGSAESDQQETISDYARNRDLKNKRFQIIDNKYDDTKSDNENDNGKTNISYETSSDIDNNENRIPVEKSDDDETSSDELYVQSPTRHLKTRQKEFRKRLKHFLPKRVHWDESEFQHLRNFWINGPKGRYPYRYKTIY